MLHAEKNPIVSFGTTVDRPIFPVKDPNFRLGTGRTAIRGDPSRGPGLYSNEQMTNFSHDIENRPCSLKGYTFTSRTGPRMARTPVFLPPSATTYQKDNTELIDFEANVNPFNQTANRFTYTKVDPDNVPPGPGAYECDISRNRKVTWQQSFGGNPVNLPSVSQESTIKRNTDKLATTREERKFNKALSYLKLYW